VLATIHLRGRFVQPLESVYKLFEEKKTFLKIEFFDIQNINKRQIKDNVEIIIFFWFLSIRE
jgi:hypothetical protein